MISTNEVRFLSFAPLRRLLTAPCSEFILRLIPADAQVLVPLLYRLTASDTLPILLIGVKSVGTVDAIRELDASGDLRKMVAEAGAVIDGAKRKKGRRS